MKKVENGELVYVDLGQHQGKCVQSGIRPCLVVGSYYASDVRYIVSEHIVPETKEKMKLYHLIFQLNDDERHKAAINARK